MTAQIEDFVRYRENKYSLVSFSRPLGFNPKMFDLVPMGISTGCWKGYWCGYEVTSKGLVLQNLFIHTKDDVYPPVNGVNVSEIEYQECMRISEEDGKYVQIPDMIPKHMGHREYKNLNIFTKYSGKIILGKGFIGRYYIHMGYQRAYAYEELIELGFRNGKLVSEKDISDEAARIREDIESMRSGGTE